MTLNTKKTEANNIGSDAGNKGKQNKESDFSENQSKGIIAKYMGKIQPIAHKKIPPRSKTRQVSKKEMQLKEG